MLNLKTFTLGNANKLTQKDLAHFNGNELRNLRKWCSQKMDVISKIIDETSDENADSLLSLKEQKKKLADLRTLIDKAPCNY